MREKKSYRRDDRKRLIIHLFAERLRKGIYEPMTCSQIAACMRITPSTKLRNILREMESESLLTIQTEEDASILGYRYLYTLNHELPAFNPPHTNRRASRQERTIRLNSARGIETLVLL